MFLHKNGNTDWEFLIFYGENEAEYGNPINDNSSAIRSYEYFTTESESNLYLGGTSIADLKNIFGMTSSELQPYIPSDISALKDLGAEVHYLGYYKKWHPQSACIILR